MGVTVEDSEGTSEEAPEEIHMGRPEAASEAVAQVPHVEADMVEAAMGKVAAIEEASVEHPGDVEVAMVAAVDMKEATRRGGKYTHL